jgi:hypothetical protein
MDRFLNLARQKSTAEYPRGHRTLGIVGKSGIGKTWTLGHMFDTPVLVLDYDILKGKQSTLDFLERVRGMTLPVVLDEYETLADLVGLRELTGPPTLGPFVIASQIPIDLDFDVYTWAMPEPTVEQLMAVAHGLAPEHTVRHLAEEANGDMRHVLQGVTFHSDALDNFQTPRQLIYSLLSRDSDVRPAEYIGETVHEHGYMYGVVQENYVDTTGASMDELADMAESLSRANIIDDQIYDGAWEMMPYFVMDACIYPAWCINHRLDPTKLRPGSMWTKFQNSRMRAKKVRALTRRTLHSVLDIQAIMLVRDYCLKEDSLDRARALLSDYMFESSDLDVLNHLALGHKIKAKTLGILKRCVRASPSRAKSPS